METKYLLEIVFKHGTVTRKHYDTAAAAAFIMDAVGDMEFESVTLTAVKVVTLREMAGA